MELGRPPGLEEAAAQPEPDPIEEDGLKHGRKQQIELVGLLHSDGRQTYKSDPHSPTRQLLRWLQWVLIAATTSSLLVFLGLAIFASYKQGAQLLRIAECPGPLPVPGPRHDWCGPEYADLLAKQVQQADNGTGVEVVFYGDSITESWVATNCGGRCGSRCDGIPKVYEEYFGNYSSAVLAVGGDQVAHLQWRLLHGETFAAHQPKVAVVLIGTNDLGASACLGGEANITEQAPGTADRIEKLLDFLRINNPRTHIILMALLPRGGLTPERYFTWPSDFTPALGYINLKQEERAAREPDYIHYVDCGAGLVATQQIEESLQPDALHPNAQGMELVAQCLAPFVQQYVQE